MKYFLFINTADIYINIHKLIPLSVNKLYHESNIENELIKYQKPYLNIES